MPDMRLGRTGIVRLIPTADVAAYSEHGWSKVAPEEPAEAPSQAWTKAQLEEFAQAQGVDLEGASRKADIVERLTGADGES